MAAKEGGADPDANIALRNAVEKARAVSMPKDNIERAIARGAGADANSEAYDAVTYEGYGASGAALIVEALTDNRNRTAADVRFVFSKYGGSLGTPGSVAWMFERKGVVIVPVEAADEDDDHARRRRRRRRGRAPRTATCGRSPREPHDFHGAARRRSRRPASRRRRRTCRCSRRPGRGRRRAGRARCCGSIDALEENDDVQDVYFNFDIPDAVLADA